jgi:hypothetical protein
MRRTKTLALWAILCCGSLSGRAEVDSFTICSPAAVGRIEVRYFLAGAFGVMAASFVIRTKTAHIESRSSRTGEWVQTSKRSYTRTRRGASSPFFSVDLLSDSTRTATFGCQPLSSITLAGKVSAARSSTRALDVEVRYLSFWDHTLFSFSDGITQGFNVGKAPLKPGGRFQIQIPDFSSDRVTMQMKTHSWRSS